MPGCLIALPSANVAPAGTPTWAVGTPDADYPLVNVLTLDPAVVAKANEDTATLRVTIASSTLVAAALINTNLGGTVVNLTNNGGMTPQPRTVPNPEDSLAVNVWWDLREVTSASGTQWNFECDTGTGGNPVAIGTVLLIAAAIEPRLQWNYDIRERFPAIQHRSSYQQRFIYQIPTRVRFFQAVAHWAEDRDILRSLRRATDGMLTPFFLVPDEDDSDVFLVQFAEEMFREVYPFIHGSFEQDTIEGIVEQPVEVEEANTGVAL